MTHHRGKKPKDAPPDCVPGAYLCRPRVMVKPGGPAFCHSEDCPIHPYERIDTKAYAQGRRYAAWPPRGSVA